MKLQKLLYYAYAWQLVAGEKFFEAKFKAWPYGPVDLDIYQEYKSFGSSFIHCKPNDLIIQCKSNSTLDFILDSYSVYSAIELSKTTHLEDPWKKNEAFGGYISDTDLVEFYKNQSFAQNFPLGTSKVYYPPKTSSHYAFTFDMNLENTPLFENLDHYLNVFEKESSSFDTRLKNYAF